MRNPGQGARAQARVAVQFYRKVERRKGYGMRFVIRLSTYPIAAACAALLLAGCGGGSSSGTDSASSLSLTGQVFNTATGRPVIGASVRLTPGNAPTTTD